MSSVASSQSTVRGGGPTGRPRSFPRRVLDAPWLYRLGSIAVIGLLWELGANAADSIFIPGFVDTIRAAVALAQDPRIWNAFWLSNQALIFGFAVSVVLGIPLGFAIARLRGVEPIIDPYITIMLVVPMAAIIPLLIMSLGIGMTTRIVIIILFTFPNLVVNARAGVRQVEPNLIEMATSYGASERTIWRRVLLPGSLPAIMAGIRLGLGRAVTAMVIVELLLTPVGIGGLIQNFRARFQAANLYAVVVLVVIEALILITLARVLERRIAPWATSTTLRD